MYNYDNLPEDLQGPLRRYIEEGIPPGGFLTAVLANDLAGAVGRADHVNIRRIPEIVKWIYNEAPHTCWGSYDKVNEWIANKLNSKEDE